MGMLDGMKRLKAKKRWVALLSALLVILVFGFLALRQNDIVVQVFNDTQTPLSNVDLTYTGGSIHLGTIPVKTMCEAVFAPVTDSAMVIEFTFEGGDHHRKPLDVYFTKGISGTMEIHVRDGGQITFKSALSVR